MLMRIRKVTSLGLSLRAGWLVCALLATLAASADSPSTYVSEKARTQPRYAMAPAPPAASVLVAVLPDSPRLKVLSMLAEGNVSGAVEYYVVATGARQAPQWLLGLQAAFNASNRVAGPCVEVARKIFEGFSALGENPQYLRITSTESELLAFEVRAGVPESTLQVSSNNYHVAVRIGSRIYDAFTGPQGLAESEYLKRLLTPEGRILVEEVSHP
jgi:hypothetical protein